MNDTKDLNVFFSYKDEDAALAEFICGEITDFCQNVDVFIAKKMPPGIDWNKWILESIGKSNLLFLLYTEPSNNWDWCLYEAGLFNGMSVDDNKRKVICLHNETIDPPEPIKNIQTLKSDIESLNKFFNDFFNGMKTTGLDKPLHGSLSENKINTLSKKINELITPKKGEVGSVPYNKFISLRIPFSKNKDDIVVESNALTLNMFGLAKCAPNGRNWNWSEIKNLLGNDDRFTWFDPLDEAVSRILSGLTTSKMFPTFRSVIDERIYRPVIDRKTLYADGSIKIYIPFIAQNSEGIVSEKGSGEGTLLTSILIGNRFRNEVILKFLGNISYINSPKNMDDFCVKLKGAILNIVKESESLGLLTEEKIISVFDTEQEKKDIKELYGAWGNIFIEINDSINQKDIDRIKKLLENMKRINIKFLAMAAYQYHDSLTGIIREYSDQN